MKLVIPSLLAVVFSAASLYAGAAKSEESRGTMVRPLSSTPTFVTAVPERTIDVTAAPTSVNVMQGEVIRFVSSGREFTWYFNGVAMPLPFDMTEIAPAGFVKTGVKVYVGGHERDLH